MLTLLKILNELHTRSCDQASLSSSTSLSSMANYSGNGGGGGGGQLSDNSMTSSLNGDLPPNLATLPYSQSVPSTLSRKNNLHLHLSTIIDSNDTESTTAPTTTTTTSQSPPATTAPTMSYSVPPPPPPPHVLPQQSVCSSRESSPGLQMKHLNQYHHHGQPHLHHNHHGRHSSSRDGSPSLIYRTLLQLTFILICII